MCILKQFVDNPCGVGIEWDGVITSSPPRAMRERASCQRGVCAEDGYCGGLAVLLFSVYSFGERSFGVSLS